MSSRILFKLTTRGRPDKARKAIHNILDNVLDSNFLILVTCDVNDGTMNEFYFPHQKVLIHHGNSNNKVHAFNRSIHLIKDWDILVATSDDMQFQTRGFDNVIRESCVTEVCSMNWYGHLVHFNDGNQKSNVCTLSIIGRGYYDLDKYVYNPEYESLWCDVEATEVAKERGNYKYMGDDLVIFRHLHPAWGLAPYDEQYQIQDSPQQSVKDKATYERRKANGFR